MDPVGFEPHYLPEAEGIIPFISQALLCSIKNIKALCIEFIWLMSLIS